MALVSAGEKAADAENPLPVVLQLSMNAMECNAVVGSPEIFDKSNNFTVPYIAIQFYSNVKTGDGEYAFHGHCPEEDFEEMVRLLSSNGYQPLLPLAAMTWEEKEARSAKDWIQTTAVWVHYAAKNVFSPRRELYSIE